MTDLLSYVERFLDDTGMAPSTFGKEAMRDPNFVWNLRSGLDPRASTVKKVADFIAQHRTNPPNEKGAA